MGNKHLMVAHQRKKASLDGGLDTFPILDDSTTMENMTQHFVLGWKMVHFSGSSLKLEPEQFPESFSRS